MDERSSKAGRGWTRYAVWGFVLLLIYPLSAGPTWFLILVLNLDVNGPVVRFLGTSFYAPLARLRHIEPLWSIHTANIEFWTSLAGG